MKRSYLKDILVFFAVILIQVLIMDNIQFSGYINPFFYILFILLLPFETPKWLLLVSAFLLGFSIDLFYGFSGIHAAACVFAAFIRPFVMKRIAPHDGYEIESLPRVHYYGFTWFAKYSVFLVLAHNTFLFFIESFSFSGFFHTIVKIILSSLLTSGLIIISQYFIFRK